MPSTQLVQPEIGDAAKPERCHKVGYGFLILDKVKSYSPKTSSLRTHKGVSLLKKKVKAEVQHYCCNIRYRPIGQGVYPV